MHGFECVWRKGELFLVLLLALTGCREKTADPAAQSSPQAGQAKTQRQSGGKVRVQMKGVDLVVDPRERERELVVGEADDREVRVDAGHHVRVDVDVQLSLLGVLVHAPTIYP